MYYLLPQLKRRNTLRTSALASTALSFVVYSVFSPTVSWGVTWRRDQPIFWTEGVRETCSPLDCLDGYSAGLFLRIRSDVYQRDILRKIISIFLTYKNTINSFVQFTVYIHHLLSVCTKTRNAGMPECRNAGILKPGTQNY